MTVTTVGLSKAFKVFLQFCTCFRAGVRSLAVRLTRPFL